MQTIIYGATFLVFAFVGLELIKFVRAELKEDSAQYKKLDDVFCTGNQVQSTISGKTYVVVSRMDGAAFLRGLQDNKIKLVDWLTPAMTLRRGVAENWSLVTKA